MTAAEHRERTDHAAPPDRPKEYVVTVVKPGVRMKVVHNRPGKQTATYYVSWGLSGMHCTCPDAHHRRQGRCKHCRFVALLINRPDLVDKTDDPNF